MADKIAEPKKTDLIGDLTMDLEPVDAPVLQIIAELLHFWPRDGAIRPSGTNRLAIRIFIRTRRNLSAISPQAGAPAKSNITHARLAGLEVIQGIGNFAKSAFTDLFDKKDKDVSPKRSFPRKTPKSSAISFKRPRRANRRFTMKAKRLPPMAKATSPSSSSLTSISPAESSRN